MASNAKRVALLARPGEAEQRLAGVLAEASVELVLQADPTHVEVATVLGAQPDTLLVALDAPTEDALDRLEAVLYAPGIDVIYEEAAMVVAREGWDAARWRRHLLAKLQGHDNVLPPAQAPAVAAEANRAADTIPDAVSPAPASAPVAEPAFTTFSINQTYEVVAEPVLESAPIAAAMAPAEPAHTTFASSMTWSLEPGPLDAATSADDDHAGAPETQDAVVAVDPAPEPAAVSASDTDAGMGALEFNAFDPVAAEVTDTTIPPATGERWAEQAFVTDDPGAAGAAQEDRFSNDLASLELRIASMSLVDETPVRGPEKVRGAVLVLAGIGGPDAVRQLLGSLPTDFVRPVLVQQRLEGARYDRLVAQMQRATTLPVALAEAGQRVEQGTVYIIPDTVGVGDGSDGLAFVEGANDILAALPAADSAVLLLSGSDAARVDAALSFGWNGGLVVGQNIDGCYDAAAVTDLAARGGTVAKPAEMGPRLAAHWQRGG